MMEARREAQHVAVQRWMNAVNTFIVAERNGLVFFIFAALRKKYKHAWLHVYLKLNWRCMMKRHTLIPFAFQPQLPSVHAQAHVRAYQLPSSVSTLLGGY
jgi:hypothetical protein